MISYGALKNQRILKYESIHKCKIKSGEIYKKKSSFYP